MNDDPLLPPARRMPDGVPPDLHTIAPGVLLRVHADKSYETRTFPGESEAWAAFEATELDKGDHLYLYLSGKLLAFSTKV